MFTKRRRNGPFTPLTKGVMAVTLIGGILWLTSGLTMLIFDYSVRGFGFTGGRTGSSFGEQTIIAPVAIFFGIVFLSIPAYMYYKKYYK